MVEFDTTLRLAGYAVGAVGGLLVFFEFFHLPSYIDYDPDFGGYSINISPNEVVEHTWFGRAGGLLLALAFALLFVAQFLEAPL